MAAPEVPDWTRPTQLFAKDPTGEFIPVLVDANGQLYIVIQGELAGITGSVVVDQSDSIRQVQGIEGANLRTVAVDASGRLIMVPYGTTTVAGTATVTQADSIREIQGADGATLRTVVVDSAGRMIMVPMGQSGNYMAVDASGYLTTILKGLEGANLRTLVVDSAGRLVAVVKGMYDSTPTDVAVDASGRMIMIPTDPADVWGNAISMGNAELAAVFSPAKRFDRRGNVVMVEDFKYGIEEWLTSGDGTGNAVACSSNHYKTGPFSAKLTAGSDGLRYARMVRYFPTPYVKTLGFEMSFSIHAQTKEISFELAVGLGTKTWYAGFYFDRGEAELQYLNSANVETKLDDAPTLVADDYLYYTMKGVINCTGDLYSRFLFMSTEYDMGAYALRTITGATLPTVLLVIEHHGNAGYNPYIYIDDLILTVNEPA